MLVVTILVLMAAGYAVESVSLDAAAPAWWTVVPWALVCVALVWGGSVLLARAVTSRLRGGLVAGALLRRVVSYHHLLWGLRGLILGLSLWLIFGTAWPTWVGHLLGPGSWLAVDVWIIILPYLAMVLAHWGALYRVDVLLRRRQAAFMVGGPARTGRETPGPSDALSTASGVPLEPFRLWTRRQYLGFHVRHQLLMVLVPVSLWWAALDGLFRLLPLLGLRVGTYGLPAAMLLVLVVYLISPLFMRLIWNTHRLPAAASGPSSDTNRAAPTVASLRERLEALCRRLGLRCRDILIWRTNCDIVNAAVAGLTGRLRYVFLSDGLLRHMRPSEIEAVFAHEIGHVRLRHIPLYLVFALGAMVFILVLRELVRIGAGVLGADGALVAALEDGWPLLLVALALYWGVLFGYLSRRFERQADVFAIRAMAGAAGRDAGALPWRPVEEVPGSVGQPPSAAKGHTPEGGCAASSAGCRPDPPLDPLALGEFTRALESVAHLNGMTRNVPGWSHFSIARRVRFLEEALVDPRAEARFERRLRRLKWTWLAATLLGLAFLLLRPGARPEAILATSGAPPEYIELLSAKDARLGNDEMDGEVVDLVRNGLDDLAVEGDRAPDGAHVGAGEEAVVVTGAAAETLAARIEGQARNQNQVQNVRGEEPVADRFQDAVTPRCDVGLRIHNLDDVKFAVARTASREAYALPGGQRADDGRRRVHFVSHARVEQERTRLLKLRQGAEAPGDGGALRPAFVG